tara:strand:+ start:2258 stop:2662 length:405 start_codon:yes stop_codon:yes gene_type:complete
MPLILYHRIKKEDVTNNSNCYFIYSENEKKEGGKVYMRQATNCLPLTISKAPSFFIEAQWTDQEYEENKIKFNKDVDRIVKYLDRRAIIFLENRFLQEEYSSRMISSAPKTLDFINNSINYLLETYRPSHVKTD